MNLSYDIYIYIKYIIKYLRIILYVYKNKENYLKQFLFYNLIHMILLILLLKL